MNPESPRLSFTDIGRLLARLVELGIDDNTIVIFSSANGPHQEDGETK